MTGVTQDDRDHATDHLYPYDHTRPGDTVTEDITEQHWSAPGPFALVSAFAKYHGGLSTVAVLIRVPTEGLLFIFRADFLQ